MSIAKITEYVEIILSQNDYKNISAGLPNPLIVFKNIFEHYCKTAETEVKLGGPEMFGVASKRHEDFFDRTVSPILQVTKPLKGAF